MKAIVKVYEVVQIAPNHYGLSSQPIHTVQIDEVYGYNEIIKAAKVALIDTLSIDRNYAFQVQRID